MGGSVRRNLSQDSHSRFGFYQSTYDMIYARYSFRRKVIFYNLKGLSQGHNTIFKGMKMTFRTKILKKKKLYHINQRQKYYKLCFDNFSLRELFYFDRALDRGQVEF